MINRKEATNCRKENTAKTHGRYGNTKNPLSPLLIWHSIQQKNTQQCITGTLAIVYFPVLYTRFFQKTCV